MNKPSPAVIGLICALTCSAATTQNAPPAFAQAVTQQTVPQAVFSDVPVGAAHYIAIQFLKDRHVIEGYSDGTFQPLREVNRAEALKMILSTIAKAPDKDLPPATLTFPDVPATAWYASYVKTAILNGIIRGYSDGTFKPDQTINRAEILKMLLLEENHDLPVSINNSPYADVPVDSWFAAYAQVSKDRGLFLEDRKTGNLDPDLPVNRGDFAELIYHLLENSNGYTFGRATYYADSLAGHGTSSGDAYDPAVYTAAHKTLPLGTHLLVTNLANGQSVEVKVNDRGPYATGVELDLSKSAFAAVADPSTGVIDTQFKILDEPTNG